MDQVEIQTIPLYTLQATDNPELFRVVDRQGDWEFYYHQPTDTYMPAVNHINSIGFPKGAGLIEWLKKTNKEEAEERLRSRGERGSRVHEAIRDLISGLTVKMDSMFKNDSGAMEALKPDEWDCLLAWQSWAEAFNPQVSGYENALWHPKYLYAGTRDFKGKITLPAGCKISIDDKITTIPKEKVITVLLDWKTGGSYDDHKLQVAAYDAAEKTGSQYTGVVRVGTTHKSGFGMKLWSKKRTKYHFNLFLNAKQTFEWLEGYTFGKPWQPSQVEIPTQITVKIPIIKTAKAKAVDKQKKKIGKKLKSHE